VDLAEAVASHGGVSVVAPSLGPDDRRSDAASHQEMPHDRLTMTSVVMRALGPDRPRPENEYRPNAPLAHDS
jgi:hypothetical protein